MDVCGCVWCCVGRDCEAEVGQGSSQNSGEES